MHSQYNTAQQADVEVLIPSIRLLEETEAPSQLSCVQHDASAGGQLSWVCWLVFLFALFFGWGFFFP